MTRLTAGANAPLPTATLSLKLKLQPVPAHLDVDVSAFLLTGSGKVRGDQDMVFYGQPAPGAGHIQLLSSSASETQFQLQLNQLETAIERIAFSATIHENRQTFSVFQRIELQVFQDAELLVSGEIDCNSMQETALILAEVYRRNGAWKIRVIGQGFQGGLQPLAEHFGVEIEAPTTAPVLAPKPSPEVVPAAPATPVAKPPVLSKITLDKNRPSVSLEKKASGFGPIRINLNWNRADAVPAKKSFFGALTGTKRNEQVDLDLGCLFELQDGRKSVVQALGECFGALQQPPFIELHGDDRTGAISDGEWLYINGDQWSQIKRVVIFAFIYEGVPNWAATDGVVTLYVPDEAPVEIRLTESSALGMCAIALLENRAGGIHVSREVRYFDNHKDLDQAYRWGMRWVQGSKD